MRGDEIIYRPRVGDVDPMECVIAIAVSKPVKPRLLQGNLVIVVDVVDADHTLTSGEQRESCVEADEPGSAGEENGHNRGSPVDKVVIYVAPLYPLAAEKSPIIGGCSPGLYANIGAAALYTSSQNIRTGLPFWYETSSRLLKDDMFPSPGLPVKFGPERCTAT